MTATDASAALASIRTDLRVHHPYRPPFQEEDVCPVCSGFGDLGAVAWPCGPVRMAAALDAVLAAIAEHGFAIGATPRSDAVTLVAALHIETAITDALCGAT